MLWDAAAACNPSRAANAETEYIYGIGYAGECLSFRRTRTTSEEDVEQTKNSLM